MTSDIKAILTFVEDWRNKQGLPDDIKLTDSQIAKFVMDLHEEVSKMNFSIPNGATIIAYSGDSNSTRTWQIAKGVSEKAGNNAIYISDLPAGN